MPRIEYQQQLWGSQKKLWDCQHAVRGMIGPEATLLRHTPNDAAVLLASALCSPSHILEAGSANGRDARFWGKLGHKVDCIDFSDEALRQLTLLAGEEGVAHLLTPYQHDISSGTLPPVLNGAKYDAFYARSALHLEDEHLDRLADAVTSRMHPGGFIVIEGKGPHDYKIERSMPVGEGIVCDSDGHIRRVWTKNNMETLARGKGWDVVRLDEIYEEAPYGCNMMMRLIARVPYRH